MTSKSITASKDYEIRNSDEFFFDTNIWILLYCPIANHKEDVQRKTSKFYERLLNSKAYIVINSLVLSEFSNAYLRIDFNLWRKETQQYSAKFKENYFPSERSKKVRATIASTIKNKILKTCESHPDSFNAIDMEQILDYYKYMDFNDSMIAERCLKNKWKLFTDDQDFFIVDELNVIKP